jgi:hypothetical protein
MKPNLLKTICGAVAIAAGVVVIVTNTIAIVTSTITPMSSNDATALLAFGVAGLGIASLQK